MSGRKKKKGRRPADGLAMTEKQQLQKAQVRILALERELVNRSEEAAAAAAAKKEVQEAMAATRAVVEQEQEDRFDVMSSMARQYKMTQDTLMEEINALNAELVATQDELYLTRSALEETAAERDKMAAEKDAEIARLKAQMEEMAASFAVMLSDTLDSVSARIHKAKESYESQATLPSRNKLLDFKLRNARKDETG